MPVYERAEKAGTRKMGHEQWESPISFFIEDEAKCSEDEIEVLLIMCISISILSHGNSSHGSNKTYE